MNGASLSFGRFLRYGAEASAFFVFMGFFTLIGLDAASAVGGLIGRAIFARLPVGRLARDNLTAVFPEKSATEIDAILRAMWDNLGRTVAEYAHLGKFATQGPDARIRVTDLAGTAQAVGSGDGVLFLSGHFANWEMMLIVGAGLDRDGAAVVRPPNNPFVATWIARQRRLRGPQELIGKHDSPRRIYNLLRAGKSIFMLVDQKLDEGVAVPFFGREAMTTAAPAGLALKLGSRIVFAANRRLGGAHFHVTLYPGPEFVPSGDHAHDTKRLTEIITARIEQIVRDDPSQWLWIHRRWG